jgi:hypothetical protein
LEQFPVVAIVGPRQSGKTTLCRMLKPEYQYANLEDLSIRDFAKTDPKGFLDHYKGGVIIDEIQYVPHLLSYLQVYTDSREQNGEYIITGSQNFLLNEQIGQSLAGRVAIFNLLPFSISELQSGNFSWGKWETLALSGFYPRKWMNDINPSVYYENYVRTYIERDVRLIRNISNLDLFHKFIQLLAGRTGQLLNQSSLGNELGLDNKTIQSWISLLEVSFVAFRLQPYFRNFSKRIVKTPKIYFYDTGLLAYLLGIRNLNDMELHYARGQIFENLILTDLIKQNWNQQLRQQCYFWRDSAGHEIDILIEHGTQLKAVEIKSSKTFHMDFMDNLKGFKTLHADVMSYLVFGGNGFQSRGDISVLGLDSLNRIAL